MAAAGRQRDLRLVLSAGLISQAGDWILLVGMLYRVYTITGSALASRADDGVRRRASGAFGAVAGVFADRWDRKRMMITANVLQAAGLVPLLLVHSAGRVWIVFLVMFAGASSRSSSCLPSRRWCPDWCPRSSC